MNAFADWLFSVLLGWTGTAANSAWNTVVNNEGGISYFFSRYWLPIVVLLVLGGTLLDYAVWFARWKPYLVWRSWLTRRHRERALARDAHQLEQGEMDPTAQHTIADWVATPPEEYPVYDLPLQEEASAYPHWTDPSAQWVQPVQTDPWAYMPPAQQPAEDVQPTQFSWQTPVVPDAPEQSDTPTFDPAAYAQPYAELEAQQDVWFPEQVQPYQEPVPQPPAPQAPTRKRRSERGRQRRAKELFSQLRDRLGQQDDAESMIDGLPSPVREEDAFHEAVYPHNYRYNAPHYEQLPAQQQEDEQYGSE